MIISRGWGSHTIGKSIVIWNAWLVYIILHPRETRLISTQLLYKFPLQRHDRTTRSHANKLCRERERERERASLRKIFVPIVDNILPGYKDTHLKDCCL
jgi:hypothetical protein